ncbi:MAG: GDSL-type esterase/lipase family protein [Terriglobia bacterium]
MKFRSFLVLAAAGCATLSLAEAQQSNQQHWVATWTTPQPMMRAQPPRPQALSPAPTASTSSATPPAATPGTAPANPGPGRQGNPALRAIATNGFKNQTVRMVVHTSIGGSRLRIRLENSFGADAVVIGSAHVALRATDSGIVPGSDHVVTFSGKPSTTIRSGVVILSDPVDLTFPNLGDLAVSLYLPEQTGPPAAHGGLHTSYVSKEGNQTGEATIPEPILVPSYYWLAGIDVMAPAAAASIVTLGDSITEGARSTPDTDHMWPALLSARLLANKSTANLAVVDMGIGGNRLLRDGSGASALARLDRDVFSQAGVKWMTILEGINDIGRVANPTEDPLSAEDLIAGFQQIIERAHEVGIRVAGCTITPYGGAGYFSEKGEAIRQAVNTFIRGGAFDAVIDFEAVTCPAKPVHS